MAVVTTVGVVASGGCRVGDNGGSGEGGGGEEEADT